MYRSYAFTLRPRNGVTPDGKTEQKLIKYIEKNTGFLVSEMENEARHLHGQLFFPNGKRKYDLAVILIKIQQLDLGVELDKSEQRVLKGGIKIAYSDDFFTDYTNKPDSNLIIENMPDDTQQFYPSQDEQDIVKARARAVDQKYHKLSELWNETRQDQEPRERTVAFFLYDMMYVAKRIPVVADKKCFNQTYKALTQYLRADMVGAAQYIYPDEKPPEDKQAQFETSLKKEFPLLFT